MDLVDLVSRGWALRLLREARAELRLAKEEPRLALIFALEAAKKAQACIYHCLGSPDALEMLVLDLVAEGSRPRDRIAQLLLFLDNLVGAISETDDPREACRLAEGAVKLASHVVQKVLGERA